MERDSIKKVYKHRVVNASTVIKERPTRWNGDTFFLGQSARFSGEMDELHFFWCTNTAWKIPAQKG